VNSTIDKDGNYEVEKTARLYDVRQFAVRHLGGCAVIALGAIMVLVFVSFFNPAQFHGRNRVDAYLIGVGAFFIVLGGTFVIMTWITAIKKKIFRPIGDITMDNNQGIIALIMESFRMRDDSEEVLNEMLMGEPSDKKTVHDEDGGVNDKDEETERRAEVGRRHGVIDRLDLHEGGAWWNHPQNGPR
jgi:hypothetical protein